MNSKEKYKALIDIDKDRIVEMAWEDRTPFDAIEATFGYSEPQVIVLMRKKLKRNSFYIIA
jgi:uncharacterized protein (TIGR03643 family)